MPNQITKQKTTHDITVPNHDWDVLKKHFPQCFDANGKFLIEKFQQNLHEKDINFSNESYGLEWLGNAYARLLATDAATTLLRADAAHNQKPENLHAQNLLLKGDNLEVLKHLSNAYHQKIKMIYIDPPYNTGSDGFVYADDRKFTARELQNLAGIDAERAQRILDFTKSKSNSHSAWLTFMYPRLYIAKQLLKDDGVIFISIDDNEVAQLRLLMDEIFGEENFVAEFIRKTKSISSDAKIGINNQHEYCLAFAKNINDLQLIGVEKDFKSYSNPDNDLKGEWTSGDPTAMDDGRINKNISPIVNPFTGKIDYPGNGRRWKFNTDGFEKLVKEHRIIFRKEHKKNERGFILKRYKNELQSENNVVQSLLLQNMYLNQFATKELADFFDFKAFDFPKPTTFIKDLVGFHDDKEFIILDFFAGSGTTGDAVLQLNAEDDGNRKYILVQLPEPIEAKKNKTAYDFVQNELKVAEPTIFDITKERLIRAAAKTKTGIAAKIAEKEQAIIALNGKLDMGDKAEKTAALQAEIAALQAQDLGFRIFETMPIWDDYGYTAAELVQDALLFQYAQMTDDDLAALLTTWKTKDGIALTQDLETVDLGGYTAHYGNSKLYLMQRGFTTQHLIAFLERIDAKNGFNPTTVIAFAYHFDSKNLLELAENAKSYKNKKNAEITFIERY